MFMLHSNRLWSQIMVRYLAFLALFVLCLGCGEDEKALDDPYANLKFEFHTAPLQQKLEITNIEIDITSSELEQPLNFTIKDIDSAARSARASIKIPVVSSLNLSAKAFKGKCPILKGKRENIVIKPSIQKTPLVIDLSPIQIYIGVRSAQEQINNGDTYTAELYINDAPGISALTCELLFNEDILVPVSSELGNFFEEKNNVLFIEESQLPRRQKNRLTMGATLRGDAEGLCGSGTVFQITFRAVGNGNATINIVQNEMLRILTPYPDFTKIEDSRIVIEKGTSVIIK